MFNSPGIVLGIETSCDETAVSLVEYCPSRPLPFSFVIRSNVLASQVPQHAPFFGVVPELASRLHLDKIASLVKVAVLQAGFKFNASFLKRHLAAISYTRGPGLKGALLVGQSAARSLALALDKKTVAVHHLEAHLAAILLEQPTIKPPLVGLIVSGGHTDLVYVKHWGSYRVLGRTLDDACGEAFDKFSKMLGLGYPGGPIVDKMAKYGDPKAISFPRPFLEDSWDFSFSGLKTSALYWLRDHGYPRTRKLKVDLAASFQEAVCETLVFKTRKALSRLKLDTVVVAGGVAANSRLRELLSMAAAHEGWQVYFPKPSLCTDNAAMVAVLGALRFASGEPLDRGPVDPNLPFKSWN